MKATRIARMNSWRNPCNQYTSIKTKLFMMMTNGVGAFLGSKVSGYVIDKYYTGSDGGKRVAWNLA